MNILKTFDAAIAGAQGLPKGYCIGARCYDSYMENTAWSAFLEEMSAVHRGQFDDGSGGELKEKSGRPPKMASFASSGRMTYLLSHDFPGFVFEKQLSTVIGGVANLDGYLEENGQSTFVEAKCREPYSHTSPQNIKQAYRPLYAYLQERMPDVFSCTMEDLPESREMRVRFFCRGREVVPFDIKQMLCHLLGVANERLTVRNHTAPIRFLYLLYNPTELELPQEIREEILRIYQDTCAAAEGYDFDRVFGVVVDFLMQKKAYPVTQAEAETIKRNFHFALCDQTQYQQYFTKKA